MRGSRFVKVAVVWSVVLGSMLLAGVSRAEPVWVRTYNGPDSSYDEVHAIGTDDSGCVIVSGYSSLSGSDNEFVTIKYRPDGSTAWLRHFNPGAGLDGATALAVDLTGSVVATGYRGDPTSQYGDWATIKYSSAGESLWAAIRGDGDEDRAFCVGVDSAGNSYVAGQTGWNNDLDFEVVKYDASGDEDWVFIYDGGYDDGAEAVCVDRQGYTYATGWTESGGGLDDLITWKLGLGGESLWANVYDGPAGEYDKGLAIAVDPSGNIIVAGTSQDTANRENYIVIKYSPGGETLWTRRFTGPNFMPDRVSGMAVDAAGNIYVTGTTHLDPAHYNYATVKFSPGGVQRWVAYYQGPRYFDKACGLALDADANVYVAGSSLNDSLQWDVVTIKYDSAGRQLWLERFNLPSTFDEAYVLAVSRQGNVFVGGRTEIENHGIDYLTLAYGTAGAVAETPNDIRGTMNVRATVVRGVLSLPAKGEGRMACSELLDISGRKVLGLHPGANDVSRLRPGVYFVRSGLSAVGREPSAVSCHRIVIQR
uniref:Bulb-type lectin domain-containing protein n=1 Tax=candidate division WOR-3 bacterium TaxID=2052148 RepID=A0A7C4CC02_UNCW3